MSACRHAPSVGPECAECVDTHTCSEIDDDACEAQCDDVELQTSHRQDDAEAICARGTACGFDVAPDCVSAIVDSPRSDDVVEQCADCVVGATCVAVEGGACNTACP